MMITEGIEPIARRVPSRANPYSRDVKINGSTVPEKLSAIQSKPPKIDWPMIIGGKPYFAYMDFIPVAFELTVLVSAFGMVGTFMVQNDLKPHKKVRIFDKRSTDDKHIMAIDLASNAKEFAAIEEVLKASGASEVNAKDFED